MYPKTLLIRRTFAALLTLCVFVSLAQATDRFVRKDGHDANCDGTANLAGDYTIRMGEDK